MRIPRLRTLPVLALACLTLGCGDRAPQPTGSGSSGDPSVAQPKDPAPRETPPTTSGTGSPSTSGPGSIPKPPEPGVVNDHAVGDEWIYEIELPGLPKTVTQTRIVSLDERLAKVLEIRSSIGAPPDTTTIDYRLDRDFMWKPDEALMTRRADEVVDVSGITLSCEVWQARDSNVRYYYCRRMPLFPLVRMDMPDGGKAQVTSLKRGSR